MNTQGKGANFSPYKEESNARKNTQNCCRGPAHGWSGSRRGPQQIKTVFARSGVLRLATAGMSRQPWLSDSTKLTHSERVL
jgi:hypothetical protein